MIDLKSTFPFHDLPEATNRLCAESAHDKVLGKDIKLPGDNLVIIQKGILAMQWNKVNGRAVIHGFFGPGEVLHPAQEGYRYFSKTPAEVTTLPRPTVEALFNDQSFCRAAIQIMQNRMETMAQFHNIATNERGKERAASQMIRWLVMEFGSVADDGKAAQVDCGLSQEDVGAACGMPRECFARAIRPLRDAGIMETPGHNGKYVIHDWQEFNRRIDV